MFSHDFLNMSIGCGMTLSTALICSAWVFARFLDALIKVIDSAIECFPPNQDFDQSKHVA